MKTISAIIYRTSIYGLTFDWPGILSHFLLNSLCLTQLIYNFKAVLELSFVIFFIKSWFEKEYINS